MITSLDDLINNLKKANPKDYPKLIKQIDIPCSDFDKYIVWNAEAYTRNCIYRTSNFELLLLCWQKKQATPIHNHGGSKCWVYQIKGEAKEVRYNQELNVVSEIKLHPGKLTYMDDSMGVHSLETLEDEALTLHLYMNPIDQCDVYNHETKAFESKEMTYND